jgi:hypothetical protein
MHQALHHSGYQEHIAEECVKVNVAKIDSCYNAYNGLSTNALTFEWN